MRVVVFFGSAHEVEKKVNKWLMENENKVKVHWVLQTQSTPGNVPTGVPLAFWLTISLFYSLVENKTQN